MKKYILTLLAAAAVAVSAAGQASLKRNIFEDTYEAVLKDGYVFKAAGDWVPYPAYSDRAAWDDLTAGYREKMISEGEESLKYEWKPIMASVYLEYEKTANRNLMKLNGSNRHHIVSLTMAELVEGKGRFLPHLIDGLWMMTQQYTWSHAQHTRYQSTRRTLPRDEERVITLHSSNIGAAIACAWYFFKEEFDKYDPSISQTIKASLKKNILDPYLDESRDSIQHWWTGFHKKQGRFLNNWSPYCTANTITTFLLCEQDPERLHKALKRSVKTMDLYMNDIRSDGACDEGPSYWDMAVGKVYDYARLMCDASAGKMDIMKDDLFRKMGEYKSKTYFGDGWVMNFSDGRGRYVGDVFHLFRYGYDSGSKELMNYALYEMVSVRKGEFSKDELQVGATFRVLEALRYSKILEQYGQDALSSYGGDWRKLRTGLLKDIGSIWYDETQYAIMRKGRFILAAKAGNNGESHNHNDVGSGMLYYTGKPVILDPGVATYVKETFGSKRYTIWVNQSDWHNLPLINGCSQIPGRQYAAKNVSCDLENGIFNMDISGTYPEEAGCSSWNRTWTLTDQGLVLTDDYELTKRTAPDVENFICRGDVYLPGDKLPDGEKVEKGKVVIVAYSFTFKGKVSMEMTYPKELTPSITVKDLTDDKKISSVWGNELKRISFTSRKNAPLKGSYSFTITPEETIK